MDLTFISVMTSRVGGLTRPHPSPGEGRGDTAGPRAVLYAENSSGGAEDQPQIYNN